MTDYEEEITLPETTSSAASSTTEKLSTLTLEKNKSFFTLILQKDKGYWRPKSWNRETIACYAKVSVAWVYNIPWVTIFLGCEDLHY